MADIGKIQPVEIIDEMQRSYLDYAMSVIVARALPDVRDGLKPVHRRIIYAMQRMGITHAAHYSKSAKVVGEVLGKYHPHGDAPVYEALVRMAQDFAMRYPLIDGQGNFGSVDGDAPAAMRYTEVRLSTITETLLYDLDKDTVNFVDNFDGSLKEPVFLPSVLPNLLTSGASGIAVGMATNIPPHNLKEVIDATIYLIDNPQASVEDLMQHVKGPDFPTGAQIFDIDEITASYATGRGKIIMRAKADIEEGKSGKFQIIVTEIPYQVNKASLITRIAELVKDKKIEGISDLRDESDRKGLRVVVELKRDARPKAVLNNLYKHTSLQQSFPVNMVALVEGTPQTLTLKMILEEFISHRRKVITRRSQFELDEAKRHAHILEGLKIAVDNIDAVIATIKKSRDTQDAKINLMRQFKLTEVQSQAILDMQLKRLAALERQKIEEELTMTQEEIAYLEDLLAHSEKIMSVAKNELVRLKERFGDDRRTKVFKQKIGEFKEEDLIPNTPAIVTITVGGYVKRQDIGSFRTQRRGGKGITGITTKEEDTVSQLFATQTHDNLLFFTNKGRVFQLKVYDLPDSSRVGKGVAIVNLLDLQQDEKVLSILPIKKQQAKDKNGFVIMATKNGVIKKTATGAYEAIRRSGIIAIKLTDGDQLRWAKLTGGHDLVFLVSRRGMSIKFDEKDVRPMARDTMGVRGIKIKHGDELIGMDVIGSDNEKADLLVVTEKGIGKKTSISAWPKQLRGGVGVKAASLADKTGDIVTAQILTKEDEALILTSQKGQVIRTTLRSIPRLTRDTQGVIVMRLSAGDKVAAATIIKRRKEEEKDAPAPNTEKEDRPKSVQNRTKTVKAVAAKKPKIEKTPKPEKKLVKKSQKS
ncbi:DNA gyrase subunit A [Candidatus Curtissbacteria bacterium RIFCSPHIGHO2_01_FULL_41_44]|uniref:DNA gyrase subunit A n=1 Tax=Candidatus Curtissbacteria bacterium RIFCSPLOWO2_01_FULL_42_50 TaxID=1797730 RepID=A0A1F5H7U8_9BACT|nr:MAG: DNA gyrase subunit A [Candidatus Curtissbacteria bacterium RIFCSPHIGHO2_01_FULL_41_44]OGD94280.1 MAG: DNA gyrase subunit A [Candidatus Curtissbacteria bacterium RIFCSPHIGHO2_02_FULL_42_58]OGD97754.1 MAG: DNA gyrase subunit A [Candidatus Curtissbacteria bacterium RIFCSPHIGHO2_12_FULL_42_33]OGE00146.1 MAG: DNA gyrase subunit A [Candidatus Curtissbacteria bacterium RIFCSPLOWO2_01_FULL_42_50]OGE02072.1 MAG: DNA gyrase subunit A [Candidatus Curtissbacteria bacterium RIFCSPLOWO2_12_FULL_41_16